MASEINGYTKGTVGHLYLTSDGGMNLPTLYKMVGHLKAQNMDKINVYFHLLFLFSHTPRRIIIIYFFNGHLINHPS